MMITDLDIPEIKLYSPFRKANGSYYDYTKELTTNDKQKYAKMARLLMAKGWEEIETVEDYRILLKDRHVIKLVLCK